MVYVQAKACTLQTLKAVPFRDWDFIIILKILHTIESGAALTRFCIGRCSGRDSVLQIDVN
jgi:hypothetical protein